MNVIEEIAAERRRQIEDEGWSPEHDDTHVVGEMAQAASCYADRLPFMIPVYREGYDGALRVVGKCPRNWPGNWSPQWWKPTTRRRDLIKAAALIVAEIERLDRSALKAAE